MDFFYNLLISVHDRSLFYLLFTILHKKLFLLCRPTDKAWKNNVLNASNMNDDSFDVNFYRQLVESNSNVSTMPSLFTIMDNPTSYNEVMVQPGAIKHYYYMDTYEQPRQFEHRVTRSLSRNFPIMNSLPPSDNFSRASYIPRPGYFTLDTNVRFNCYERNIIRIGQPEVYSLTSFNQIECVFDFNYIVDKDITTSSFEEIIDQLNDMPADIDSNLSYDRIKIIINSLDNATYSLITYNPTLVNMHFELYNIFTVAFVSKTFDSLQDLYSGVRRYFITLKSLIVAQQKILSIAPFMHLINAENFLLERLPFSSNIHERIKPRLMPVCFDKADDKSNLTDCAICLESNVANVIFYPCMHNHLCEGCTQMLRQWTCPICRSLIHYIKIKINK